LNTEDLNRRYRIELNVSGQGEWSGRIIDELNREIFLHEIKVAWFRKPSFDFFGHDANLSDTQRFISSECRATLDILYSLPNVSWVNDPFAANKAKSKFQQLILAARLGMSVPRTLVTNHPHRVEEFAAETQGFLLTKAVYTPNVVINGRPQGIPSKKIEIEDLKHLGHLFALGPAQLQDYVDKAFELRVTIIGETVFAIKIESQSIEAAKVDWRPFVDSLRHTEFSLPERVQRFCIDFVLQQRLKFGAMDFIVTSDDEYFFLENNPFGQYLWLENKVGLPLTRTMCDYLEGLASGKNATDESV